MISLHNHTKNSDGEYGLDDVINNAIKNKASIISINDHECINSIDVSKYSLEEVKLLNGIEVCARDYPNLHILAYGFGKFEITKEVYLKLEQKNLLVYQEIIASLQKQGIEISVEKVIKQSSTHSYNKNDIKKYLVISGYAKDLQDAYVRFIGNKNGIYVPTHHLDSREIINLFHSDNAVSSIAHPQFVFSSVINQKEKNFKTRLMVEELAKLGIDGIEVLNAKKDSEKTLAQNLLLAEEFDLIKLEGTDFHNKSDKRVTSENFFDKEKFCKKLIR